MPVVAVRLPSPGYFKTARIPLRRRPRLHRGGRLRQAARGDRQREHREAVLARPGSDRQAHHADDDDEGAGARSSAWCAR